MDAHLGASTVQPADEIESDIREEKLRVAARVHMYEHIIATLNHHATHAQNQLYQSNCSTVICVGPAFVGSCFSRRIFTRQNTYATTMRKMSANVFRLSIVSNSRVCVCVAR